MTFQEPWTAAFLPLQAERRHGRAHIGKQMRAHHPRNVTQAQMLYCYFGLGHSAGTRITRRPLAKVGQWRLG
jgi:hypothetical protein